MLPLKQGPTWDQRMDKVVSTQVGRNQDVGLLPPTWLCGDHTQLWWVSLRSPPSSGG